jgi:hypothetical protein
VSAQTLVAKVWNFAHVLRDQGVSYEAYISQISYLLFLKMDEERVTQIGEASMLPDGSHWGDIKDLSGEALNGKYVKLLDRYCQLADRRSCEDGELSPGAFPWNFAATPGSAIPRQATIAPERSVRSSDDDMAWRGQLWRLATGSSIRTKRWRCRADVNRFKILSRRRVGRCAFSARLLSPLCPRCVKVMLIPVRAAPSEPGLPVTITRGVRGGLRMSLGPGFSAARRPSWP